MNKYDYHLSDVLEPWMLYHITVETVDRQVVYTGWDETGSAPVIITPHLNTLGAAMRGYSKMLTDYYKSKGQIHDNIPR